MFLQSGILLGPSALGRIEKFQRLTFPNYSFPVLETMGHFALVYYAFLMGLQTDVKAILRTGAKPLNIAITGIIIPFVLGASLFFIFKSESKLGFLFWGSALTITGHSVLTRILEKQRILHTEIGKTAMAAALVNDISAWILLSLALGISSSQYNIHWTMIATGAFVTFCVYYVRRALVWILRKLPEGQGYSEYFMCSILVGVAICGVITDAFGTHPTIGAFVFGLVIPNQLLEASIVDRLEDFITGIFMPVFFVVCGLRTNVAATLEDYSWVLVGVVIIFACSAKILSCVVASFFIGMPITEAVAIGTLTNAKGIMVMIILELGQLQGVLDTNTYSIMVVASLAMTMIVTPITTVYRPSKELVPYKRRTIRKAKADEELRILACIYGTRNVPAIINILESSHSSRRSPISVFALQLVELIGRASAMLVIHNSQKTGSRNLSHEEAQTSHMISAFDNYELRSEGVTTQAMTARSSFNTMDEDICSIARERRVAFIILPFHKQQTLDGDMEDANPLTAGLADWCDCPELGAIGDLLVTSEFESAFSILVVQQYVKTTRSSTEGSVRSASTVSHTQVMEDRPSLSGSETALDGFPSFRRDE